MPLCRYCSQKVGWFSDEHKECVIAAKEGCKRVVSLVTSIVKEKLSLPIEHPDDAEWFYNFAGRVWSKAKADVDRVASEHHIPAEELRQALISGWSIGVEQISIEEPLSPDKGCTMNGLYKAMGLSDEQVKNTDGFMAECFSMLLWSVMVSGDPTPFASLSDHPFNLQSGEIPLFFFKSVVYSKDTLTKSYDGGYGGMSVRVGRGMYYHLGGFKGQRTDSSMLTKVDFGVMLLTTHSLYFGGDHTSFRIRYDDVVSFRPHSDGIGVFRNNANAKAEVFTVLETNPTNGSAMPARPVTGWFLFNMARFLAQPEARAHYV